MGVYLNPKNSGFKRAIASEIYVDKTGLIEYTNKVLGTGLSVCQSAKAIWKIYGGQYALCILQLWMRLGKPVCRTESGKALIIQKPFK